MKSVFSWILAILVLSQSTVIFTASAQNATSTDESTSTPVVSTPTPTPTSTPFLPSPTIIPTTTPPPVHNAKAVEQEVRSYFADIPIMIEVARCESKFRQFADSGNVLRGGTDRKMIGIFQIYEDVHRSRALSLNMDIDTISGNMRYARYLYERERTSPWISSMPCWNTSPVNEGGGSTVNTNLTTTLIFGMNHPEVQTLQQILNRIGYTVTTTGSGSPGNETTLFGGLTRAAVRRFQCNQKIVCSGDEYTTSYGVVGPQTREALLRLSGNSGSPMPVPTPTITPTPSPTTTPDTEAHNALIRKQIEELRRQIVELERQIVN